MFAWYIFSILLLVTCLYHLFEVSFLFYFFDSILLGYVFNSLCQSLFSLTFWPFPPPVLPFTLSASNTQASLLFLKLNRHVSLQGFCFSWSLCQERYFPLYSLSLILLRFNQMSPPYVKTETYHSHHIPWASSPTYLFFQQRSLSNIQHHFPISFVYSLSSVIYPQ